MTKFNKVCMKKEKFYYSFFILFLLKKEAKRSVKFKFI